MLSSTSDIKKLNLFCVDGCGLRQGPQAITYHWWFYGFQVLGLGFYFSPFKDQNPITCYIGRYRPPYTSAIVEPKECAGVLFCLIILAY